MLTRDNSNDTTSNLISICRVDYMDQRQLIYSIIVYVYDQTIDFSKSFLIVSKEG
jgi:hypothetical protein